jgi:hypothetical protein
LPSAVQRDHASAAQAQIVLKRQPRAVDLAIAGPAAQLLDKLGALREPDCAERMALSTKGRRTGW